MGCGEDPFRSACIFVVLAGPGTAHSVGLVQPCNVGRHCSVISEIRLALRVHTACPLKEQVLARADWAMTASAPRTSHLAPAGMHFLNLKVTT